MRRLLKFLPLIVNSIALAAVIWIIVPAPAYQIWLLSVAASEWSLWFGALALLGIIAGLFSRKFNGKGKLWFAAFLIGSLAFLISLYPLFTVLPIARQRNVSLSLKTYFSGVWKENIPAADESKDFTTHIYAQPGGENLQLDIYLPTTDSDANGASVVVVHGGSWNGGARNDFPQWNWWLAAQGYTVFDIDYRLAPQPNYLTATGDVKCAVRWIKSYAAEFKISPDRIAILGRSAGAHLALLAAYSAEDARLPATCSEGERSETVRAVVSFYAPTDLPWDYDNPANQSVIDGPATLIHFLGDSPRESTEMFDRYVLASPVAHISSETPPTLLIHGGRDQLVRSENMTRLTDKLKAANVLYETLFIPYAQHGFDYNFNGFGAQIAQPAILDFLRENTR